MPLSLRARPMQGIDQPMQPCLSGRYPARVYLGIPMGYLVIHVLGLEPEAARCTASYRPHVYLLLPHYLSGYPDSYKQT
jgi:hypothetical protein